jgi:hypothetical protein
LDAHRRRYVAQAAGFGNESASDRFEDEPRRRCHSIAEEQAEGEGEVTAEVPQKRAMNDEITSKDDEAA